MVIVVFFGLLVVIVGVGVGKIEMMVVWVVWLVVNGYVEFG